MNEEVKTVYVDRNGSIVLSEPNMQDLLNITEMQTLTVHGKPILVSTLAMQKYLEQEGSAITNKEEMEHFLESRLSVEDVEKLYKEQVHRRIVGKQFSVTDLGSTVPVNTEELTLVVPRIVTNVHIIEEALEAIEFDDISTYLTYLPGGIGEDGEEKKIPLVTGNTLRAFLNDMQDEEGGLDMNSQINIYAKLLTHMPDDDPTKQLGLMQLRALMVYGDGISNKNLRLALTALLKED